MAVADDLLLIKDKLPNEVKLVAVSKTQPNEKIMEAYHCGHRIFGENKVQDLASKYETLPKDIQWHFIGHLQRNKVKYITSFVDLLHGVDSLKLLETINKEANKNGRTVNCLLQVKIASEDTKYGLNPEDLENILNSDSFLEMKNISIIGLMGMATNTSDKTIVRQEFRKLSSIFNMIRKTYFSSDSKFRELSMGMSHDYAIAIEEGATMIRIGSSIFGERIYSNKK